MPLPKVVIVGRPNVGKSSLLNWLAARRIAIVDQVAGVTRDRISALAQLGDDEEDPFVEVIDTGGIGMVDRDELAEHVERQIEIALGEADVVLFVVDAHDGRMPLDEEVAQRLRYIDRPIILVVNKADTAAHDANAEDFYKLGRGKAICVSTVHNRNKAELIRLIREMASECESSSTAPADAVMKIAVVGRPNTGKSTFINTLARAERMIVSEFPGTTRDSVDVRFELDGLSFLAIDTAGVKRKSKVREDVDYYSMHRAERSIRRADVVLLFLDPTQGVARLDKQLADYVVKQHKPCVLVINKWDTMVAGPDDSPDKINKYAYAVQHNFRTMPFAPLAFITAKTGKNVKALLNLAQSMFKQAGQRVSTSALNKVVREAVEANPPPMRENRTPKVYFATQVSSTPPTIVLFVNSPPLFDATYQRYLLNLFREQLPFHDIPIRLYLRARVSAEESRRRGGTRKDEARAEAWSTPHDSGFGDLNREVNDMLSGRENF